MISLFSSLELFYISIFICFMNVFLNVYKEYKESNVTYDSLKESFNKFIKYTDRYYISNFFYTYISCLFYICATVILFLYIRYLFIGQIVFFMKKDPNYIFNDNLIFILFHYFLFICCLLFYKHLFKNLFYIEIIKLKIYISKNVTYNTIKDILLFPAWTYLCGFLWMLCYRIATLNFDPFLFDKDFDYWFEKQLDSLEHKYDFLYKNIFIQKISSNCIYLSDKYSLIKNIFFVIAKIFKIFHRHAETNCFMFTHYTFFILLLLYELYYSELYYIYYGSFFLFLIILFKSYRDFENKFSLDELRTLHEYFYGKIPHYKVERLSIFQNNNYQLNLNIWPNKKLFMLFNTEIEQGFVYSVYNNLESYAKTILDPNNIHYILLYIRNSIIFSYFIIGILYLFKSEIIIIKLFGFVIPLWYLILSSLIIMLFCSNNTFYKKYANEYSSDEAYIGSIHNTKYVIIFWIITILQGYLFWLIIFKPQIMFINTEILLQLPYDIIYIEKVYSIQEKIMYLFQYFEYYLMLFDSQDLDKEYLRHILRQMKFLDLFQNDDINLRDIQVYIKLLIDNYYIQQFIIPYLIQIIEESNPWYLFLRNSLAVASIFNTLCYLVSLYFLSKSINTSENTYNIVKDIMKNTLYKKITMPQFIRLFLKILKSHD